MKKRKFAIVFFPFYSYLSSVLWFLADLMPPFVRVIIFKFFFASFGRSVLFDYGSYVRYPWKVKIGSNVTVNRKCNFYPAIVSDSGSITIENGATIGPQCTFFAAGHDYTSLDLADTSGPITVCKDVWIGGGSTVLPGVTIGQGAVIGAGSVVTKSIPPFSVAVGVPAVVVNTRRLL